MDEINGNLIFWFICLGFLVGGLVKLFFGNKGRSTVANVLGGAAGAVVTGLIAEEFGIAGSIAFGVMGTTAFLILFNVFCLVDDPYPLEKKEKMHKHEEG